MRWPWTAPFGKSWMHPWIHNYMYTLHILYLKLYIVECYLYAMSEIYYDLGSFGEPKRHGKLKDLAKFDAMFFGIHPKQANVMDPQLRMLLEVTYEALLDAGTR